MPLSIDLYKFNRQNRYNALDLSKSYEKITLYEILLKASFSAFLPNFSEMSHSAKCRFGEVSFRQSGFRRSVTDPINKHVKKSAIVSSKDSAWSSAYSDKSLMYTLSS